jgi:hypothetical protein
MCFMPMRTSRTFTHLWFEAASSLAAAQVTIGWRMLDLMAHPQDALALREKETMVSEKAAAGLEGAVAAQRAGLDIWLRLMSGTLKAGQLPNATMRMALVATQPARRRAKANARRLTRRGFTRPDE